MSSDNVDINENNFHEICIGMQRTKSKIYIDYHPDSHATHRTHEEFNKLFEKYINHNHINNTGDIARLWSFILNLKQIIGDEIPGDFAELGVYRGNTSSVLAHFAKLFNREVFLFDTYSGFDEKDLQGIDTGRGQESLFENTSTDIVKGLINEDSECCHFIKGYFPESITEACKIRNYSFVSIDCDLYEPTKAGLNFFYPLMKNGSIFALHDYSSLSWPGVKKAIDEFCELTKEQLILMPDKSGSVLIRKSRD